MSGFIDRLAEILRTVLGGDGSGSRDAESRGGPEPVSRARYVDPDVQAAWNELDDYMNAGREKAEAGGPGGGGRSTGARPTANESLRQDYANLEVPFGADMDTVRRSYKRLMLRYHPDKHGGDAEKHRVALEITKKINESFERIRAGHDPRRPSS